MKGCQNKKINEKNAHSSFVCPHCFSHIHVENHLVFKIISKDNNSGLVILNSTLGNYESMTSPNIEKIDGDPYSFFCPICHASLHEDKTDKKLVMIHMINQNNILNKIYFSSIFGEQCSYVIREGKLEFFGKHYQEYMKQLEKYKDFYDSRL
jgi:hypothetical protein